MSELYCPKCGGDDIHFRPPIGLGTQRSEVTCVCEKCDKHFPPPYAWWQYWQVEEDEPFTADELAAIRKWLETD